VTRILRLWLAWSLLRWSLMERSTDTRAEAAAVAEERADEAAKQVSPFKAAFGKVATRVSDAMGSVWAFSVALLVILAWIVTGPIFGFSDTWQLVINTGTTIVTFLMVFLIQNTQNRDAKAVHLKLDELIRALHGARNKLVDLEKLSDDELRTLEEEFERLRKKAEGAKEKMEELQETASERAN
jgi:low affinity Fe/Cu permease